MSKSKIPLSVNQKGHVRTYGSVWYGLYRRPQRVAGGAIKLRQKKVRLGPVSQISREEAERELRQIISRVRTMIAPSDGITVREFYERHYRPEHIENLAPPSQEALISNFTNHILPAIGDERLQDIDLTKVQALCDLEVEAGLTVTVEKIKFNLSSLLKRAIAHGIINRNCATAIRLSKITHKELHAPTLEQAAALITELADPRYSPCREMALLACSTSTNHAEMAGLLWRRVNLTNELMTVEGKNLPPFSLAVWNNNNRGFLGPPKAKSRSRVLPLGEDLVAALSALKQRSQFNGPNDPVFAAGNKAIHYDTSLRKLKKAGKRVDIPWISWHALRRFFANISDQFGMPERSYMLGHASAAMTQHYTTAPEIDRKRPYVQQITRALLDAGVTTALPTKSKFDA